MIRNHFHLLDLDPSFRIANETEMLLLKNDLIEVLFEELYEKEEEGFHSLVESYGGKKEDTDLQDMILRIYDFIQSNPWPEEWLKEQVERFNPHRNEEFDRTPWASIIKEQVKTEAEGLLEIANHALAFCFEPNGPEKYIDALEDDIWILKKIITLCEGNTKDLHSFVQQIGFTKLATYRNNEGVDFIDEVKSLGISSRGYTKRPTRKDFL